MAAKDSVDTQKLEEWIEKIHYSDRYSDDDYEYRHVILPKPLFKMIPKTFFNPDNSGTLRLLDEKEWRGIGITQSLGWEHYEVHAPEPHVLLFRRPKNFDAELKRREQDIQQQIVAANAKTKLGNIAARRK